MPDPTRATISATEASALFDVSPYLTRWMLWRRFAKGEEAFKPTDGRMDWGKKLEPLVLAQAADDLKLEVRPNVGPDGGQTYIRRGMFGCTRDADVICPERGPGACETKCVFDYRTWMQEWDGGNKVPRQHEIQVQVQMYVGDGVTPYKWGVFGVWIAGEVFYYERKPIPSFWDALDAEAARFFADVKADNEPEPFGIPVEYPLLDIAFPIDPQKVTDWRDEPDAEAMAESVRMFEYHREQRLAHTKGEDALKAKFRKTFLDSGKVLLPHGINLTLKQNKTGVGVKTYIPADLDQGSVKPFQGGELGA
jgi:hypothetical protein